MRLPVLLRFGRGVSKPSSGFATEGRRRPAGHIEPEGQTMRMLPLACALAAFSAVPALADDSTAELEDLKKAVADAGIYSLLGIIRERDGQLDAAEALLNRCQTWE